MMHCLASPECGKQSACPVSTAAAFRKASAKPKVQERDENRHILEKDMEITGASSHESGISPDGNTEDSGAHEARKPVRVRAACMRCQRRKIKCDGASPSCSSCRKAGTTCIENGRKQEYPRAYISSLRHRIAWLETMLTERCPEVDLSEGPRVLPENERIEQTINQDQRPLPALGIFDNPPEGPLSSSAHHPRQTSTSIETQPERLAHEIGLVSVTGGQDLRYLGPSSGYFFAKLVLARAGRQGHNSPPSQIQNLHPMSEIARGVLEISPTELPSTMDAAVQLSKAYWEVIQPQYPFLHQPSHMKLLEHVYSLEDSSATASFQVNMVLAISATILSRRLKVPLSAEGYCAKAMTYFDKIRIEASLQGLQSLLLLQMYAMHNPSTGLNVWYVNYQCIAAVLDLGLQRNVRAGKNLSLLTQEMRTRIFWVVYSLDRRFATIMGRPIGLRDEACELRFPQDIEDDFLSNPNSEPGEVGSHPTSMTAAIHLMKLAALNSEIKYVANSISHSTPAFTYPRIPDIHVWQRDIIRRLQNWHSEIPQFDGPQIHMTHTCLVRYYEVMMLLLRPSPAIPNPSLESLQLCQECAVGTLRIFDGLYRGDLLVYSWVTVHSVFLATITMLYCIWVLPGVAKDTRLDILVADLKAGSNVLSATAEHWTEAKRSRDVLDELSSATIRWIMDSQGRPARLDYSLRDLPTQRFSNDQGDASAQSLPYLTPASSTVIAQDFLSPPLASSMDDYLSPDLFASLFGGDNTMDSSLNLNINSIMQNVFNDFHPPVDFGHEFILDSQSS